MTSDIPPFPGDTLLFSNDRVRVWSMTLQPHGMFDFHQHHHDHIVLWPDAGRAVGQDIDADAWDQSQVAEAGFVMFKTVGSTGPIAPHRIRNLEDYAVTHFIVELLDPSPSTTELPAEHNDRGYHVRGAVDPTAEVTA